MITFAVAVAKTLNPSMYDHLQFATNDKLHLHY